VINLSNDKSKWSSFAPMAATMRPENFNDFVGQNHIVEKGTLLRRLIEADNIPSMIFWGPPGSGKTTLARIIAKQTSSEFVNFSAVTSGIKEVKSVMERAEVSQQWGNKTIVFVDEIHRFNKGQQDAFLPFVENGSIILIGATTENPSFEVNSALLSRCKVFLLHAHSKENIELLLLRAIKYYSDENKLDIDFPQKFVKILSDFASGDARNALNTIEIVLNSAEVVDSKAVITAELVQQAVSKKIMNYDKNGEEHYNIISALHKSMRNSDVDAALYWLARMLESGEDPLYIARRIIRFASEDIGLADSNALLLAVSAFQACHFNGMPECGVNLAHATVYCSLAPKSNAVDIAITEAAKDAVKTLEEPVPLVIRNAPTQLMKELDYGKGYKYAHDIQNKIANIVCLPEKLQHKRYYYPTNEGREKRYTEIIDKILEIKKSW